MLDRLDALAEKVERVVQLLGHFFAWASVLLMVNILVQVVMRYLFSRDMIALGELQWHFYAVMVMMSISFAQKENAHVRVDLFHRRFSARTKRIIEIVGILFFFVPLFVVVFWYGLEFTQDSFRISEMSPSPGGLPWRWAIKAFIPIGAVALLLNSLARVIRLITGSATVEEQVQSAG